jgi:hypothetical protein
LNRVRFRKHATQRASCVNLVFRSDSDAWLCVKAYSLGGFVQTESAGMREGARRLRFDLLLDIRNGVAVINIHLKRLSGAIDRAKNFERARLELLGAAKELVSWVLQANEF